MYDRSLVNCRLLLALVLYKYTSIIQRLQFLLLLLTLYLKSANNHYNPG